MDATHLAEQDPIRALLGRLDLRPHTRASYAAALQRFAKEVLNTVHENEQFDVNAGMVAGRRSRD